jgi:tetratricopeptide (TPR) repeat protein
LDAEAAREALRHSSATLVLITSDRFFDEVIRHTPGGRASAYRQVSVAAKETQGTAWLYLPDGARPSEWTRPVEDATTREALPVPRQLPGTVRMFVGRAEELGALTRYLDEPEEHATVPVVAITGTAGVGKTALAVRWAHQVRDRFPDGDLYVNLRGYDPGTPAAAQQTLDLLLDGLGLPSEKIPTGVEAKTATYRSHLTGRRMLVILDNAADAEQVRPLLPSSPGCAAVVTSRSRLAGLVAGDGAYPLSLNHLPEEDALTLLRHIIGAERVSNEPQAALDIARHCSLLPLALRIAAERTAARPHIALAKVAADLANEQHRLDLLDTGDPATAIRAVFSWSYRALPADLAHTFRLLGLHPGAEISVKAAATLLDTTPTATRRLLDRLTGLHLLEETAHNRYHFHDLLRSYAAEAAKCEESTQDYTAAERRIIGWYLHALADAATLPSPLRRELLLPTTHLTYWPPDVNEPNQSLTWWLALNVRTAIRRAANSGHHDLAWRLPAASFIFFYFVKYRDDWITELEIGLASARRIHERFGEAAILTDLGWAYHDLRRFDESIDHSAHALRIFQEIGQQWGQGAALHLLGAAHQELRSFEKALGYLQQARSLFRKAGDLPYESFALIQLGLSANGLRQFTEAIDYFQTALTMMDALGHRLHGWVHHGLSYAYRSLEQFPQAITHAEHALVLFDKTADLWGQGQALYSLGRAQHLSGQHDAAHQSLTKAHKIFEDLHTPLADRVLTHLQTLNTRPHNHPNDPIAGFPETT